VKHKKNHFLGTIDNVSHSTKVRIIFYVCSVLIGLSFIVFGLEWLTFLSFIGWLYYADNLKLFTKKQILIDFYLGTFIVSGFAYCWLMQAEAQNWNVSLHGWFKVVAQIISWLLVCTFTSIGGLLLGWFMAKYSKHKNRLLIFVLLVPLAEIVKSYLFAVISYGNGGSLAPNFFAGSLAVSASGTPLVFASRFVGLIGLSLLSSLLCLAIYSAFTRRYKYSIVLILIIGVSVYLGYKIPGNKPHSSKKMKVAIVHLNEADTMANWQDYSKIPEDIDLLVLPEYSEALESHKVSELTTKLSKNGIAVTTIDVGRSPDAVSRLIAFDSNKQIISQQDKTFLIPAGEYLPYSLIGAFKLLGQNKNIENFKYVQQIKPGKKQIMPINGGNITVGALACSGVISSTEYKRLVLGGAEILTNSASLSFLKQNSRFDVFGRNMARYQAVANNRYFTQASRSGESYIISPEGQFIAHNRGGETQVMYKDLKL